MKNNLYIKNKDHQKISDLLDSAPFETRDFLQNELDRATIVADEDFPEGVVAMNSTVTYIDLETQKTNILTLVYPQDAKIEEAKVSILAPVGAALIGLHKGQKIKWPLRQGKEKEIQVIDVRQSGL